ncbi:MAG: 2-iminobutanoate/2-iminopropanoate deaminase [Candidatus Scalindua arabica]|uniref:2-iminobutanoate/2-iminopropanoate deaminase n=1 Tax=Candidatus Scalindua arabica TaxID=1127984 RepID=A0A941ZYI3_9BACT|nr:2-iminobutanoate/2-iminopropanoate deaminase [Candidatus Scalindua arabica]
MQKEIISTKDAPQAIGPYSQAIRFDNLIFVSGQIPIDPETGKILQGDINEQTKLILKNMDDILTAGGSSLNNVLRTTIFLTDLENYPVVNETYAQYFHDLPPARSTVQVAKLPMDAQIEIDAIACVNTEENLLDA